MGGNPQFGYSYRPQPNPSYGSRPGTWMLLVSGGATALALLIFTASFLGWTELRFNYDEGIMRLNVNGWGRVVVTGAPEGADVVDSKFSSAGVGVPANVTALSLLIVGAVMLWQAVKPRVAFSMWRGSGGSRLGDLVDHEDPASIEGYGEGRGRSTAGRRPGFRGGVPRECRNRRLFCNRPFVGGRLSWCICAFQIQQPGEDALGLAGPAI